MDKEFIEEIQRRILELLPEEKHQDKAFLLGDSCSELSRLVAGWINERDNSSQQVILKGENVLDRGKSHDILASIKNGKVQLIDPTIWQFFPDAESILIGEYPSLDDAINEAKKKYSGSWQKSEDLKEISSEEKDKWLRIVKENIKEALDKY